MSFDTDDPVRAAVPTLGTALRELIRASRELLRLDLLSLTTSCGGDEWDAAAKALRTAIKRAEASL